MFRDIEKLWKQIFLGLHILCNTNIEGLLRLRKKLFGLLLKGLEIRIFYKRIKIQNQAQTCLQKYGL